MTSYRVQEKKQITLKFQQLTKLIIKPFKYTEHQQNKNTSKSFPQYLSSLIESTFMFANFNILCLIFLWYFLTVISSFTQFLQAFKLILHAQCGMPVA